jgi:hypothetical protein
MQAAKMEDGGGQGIPAPLAWRDYCFSTVYQSCCAFGPDLLLAVPPTLVSSRHPEVQTKPKLY